MQLYHQCLYGVRYDFLCANFTAFDQKTFICHFVSEVDCKNSHKWWGKNDDLYKATTARPVPTQATTTTTTTQAPPPRAGGNRPRRPYRRRRPQVEYYDDEYDDEYYYEEAPKRRRKQRPRPRRPIQAEYDDEYADDLPPKRVPVVPAAVAPMDDYDYDRRMERPRPADRRRPTYDDRRSFDDDGVARRRPADERRSFDDRRPNRKNTYEGERRRPAGGDRKPMNDFDQPRKRIRDEDLDLDEYEKPRRQQRPQVEEEVKVKPSGNGGTPSLFAPRVPPKIRRPVPINAKDKFDYTSKGGAGSPPASSTTEKPLFDDEDYYADDYPADTELEEPKGQRKDQRSQQTTKAPSTTTSTTTTTTTTTPPPPPPQRPRRPEIITDEEYYDDEYEDDPLPVVVPVSRGKYNKPDYNGDGGARHAHKSSPNKAQSTTTPPQPTHAQKTPHHQSNHPSTSTTRTTTTTTEQEEEERYEEPEERFSSRYTGNANINRPRERTAEPVATTTPRTNAFNPKYEIQFSSFNNNNNNQNAKPAVQQVDPPQYDDEEDEEEVVNNRNARPMVRVVKRPFLPSRGGNPILPRGLQPVGHLNPFQSTVTTTTSTTPAPQRNQNPPQYYDSKLEEIYNTDYDVTLNDALNPTLKPFTRGAGPLAAPSPHFVERNRFAGNSNSRYDSLEAPSTYRGQAQSRVRPLNVYQQPYSPAATYVGQRRRSGGQVDQERGYLRAQGSSHYQQRAVRAGGDYYY